MDYGLYTDETDFEGAVISNPYIEFNHHGDPDKIRNHRGQASFANFIGELDLAIDCKMWDFLMNMTSPYDEICQLN